MNFQRREKTIEVDGQSVTLEELSAGQFDTIAGMDDTSDQVIEFIYHSLKGRPAGKSDIKQWPSRVVNEISSSVMALNGLTEQGN